MRPRRLHRDGGVHGAVVSDEALRRPGGVGLGRVRLVTSQSVPPGPKHSSWTVATPCSAAIPVSKPLSYSTRRAAEPESAAARRRFHACGARAVSRSQLPPSPTPAAVASTSQPSFQVVASAASISPGGTASGVSTTSIAAYATTGSARSFARAPSRAEKSGESGAATSSSPSSASTPITTAPAPDRASFACCTVVPSAKPTSAQGPRRLPGERRVDREVGGVEQREGDVDQVVGDRVVGRTVDRAVADLDDPSEPVGPDRVAVGPASGEGDGVPAPVGNHAGLELAAVRGHEADRAGGVRPTDALAGFDLDGARGCGGGADADVGPAGDGHIGGGGGLRRRRRRRSGDQKGQDSQHAATAGATVTRWSANRRANVRFIASASARGRSVAPGSPSRPTG